MMASLAVISGSFALAAAVEYEYDISNNIMSYSGGKAYCETGFNGLPASITSQEERNMIHNMAKSEGPTNYYIGAERVGSSKAW